MAMFAFGCRRTRLLGVKFWRRRCLRRFVRLVEWYKRPATRTIIRV
jgi:hypothetical protein